MDIERPDLSQMEPEIMAYIEALEAEVERLQQAGGNSKPAKPATRETTLAANEPLNSMNVVTVSQSGVAKRTPRHEYARQRRGGMGIFDLETDEDDPPATLVITDESQDLLLITNRGRVFRSRLNRLLESPIRSRGQSLVETLPLTKDETLALVMPHRKSGYLNVITTQGQLRRLRHHFFGDNMTSGNHIYDARRLGAPAAACWSTGLDYLFVATRQGKAIRFPEQQIPMKGCQAIRLAEGDAIVAVTAVREDEMVFLLGADGKGTIRLMDGFGTNKSPGGGGKIAMKTDQLVGAITVAEDDDIFIISRLSKIIRFQAAEVPAKEGVVQGVNCMTLRADEPVALARAILS